MAAACTVNGPGPEPVALCGKLIQPELSVEGDQVHPAAVTTLNVTDPPPAGTVCDVVPWKLKAHVPGAPAA